jgi:hypothetical protein
MEPFLRGGDRLVVRGLRPGEPRLGDVLLYRAKGGALVCHRLTLRSQGGKILRLRGDSAWALPEAVERSRVLWLASAVLRKDGSLTSLESGPGRWLSLAAALASPLTALAYRVWAGRRGP